MQDDDHVRIKNEPYLCPLTLAIALAMSDRFILFVALACFRAFSMMASKSGIEGRVMVLRMTATSSPPTTNRSPALSPSWFRTSSGITICPLDDNFVVATDAVAFSSLKSYQ